MEKTSHRDTLLWVLEEYGPYVLGLAGAAITVFCATQGMVNGEVADKLLDSTVIFGSIIIGFVGALLGILFTIRNTKLVALLFDTWGKEKLKGFFRQNIVAGFMLVLVTMLLYARGGIDGLLAVSWGIKPSVIVFSVWGYALAFTLASTYRTVNIMMHIIFSDNRTSNEELAPLTMDNGRKSGLKEKLKK